MLYVGRTAFGGTVAAMVMKPSRLLAPLVAALALALPSAAAAEVGTTAQTGAHAQAAAYVAGRGRGALRARDGPP